MTVDEYCAQFTDYCEMPVGSTDDAELLERLQIAGEFRLLHEEMYHWRLAMGRSLVLLPNGCHADDAEAYSLDDL